MAGYPPGDDFDQHPDRNAADWKRYHNEFKLPPIPLKKPKKKKEGPRKCEYCKIPTLGDQFCDVCDTMFEAAAKQPGLAAAQREYNAENLRMKRMRRKDE